MNERILASPLYSIVDIQNDVLKLFDNFDIPCFFFLNPLFEKMKLLTHNMLQCHVKDCKKNNFPLKIEALTAPSMQTTEFNKEFILNMLLKIDYNALLQALEDLKIRSELQMPDQLPEDLIAKPDSHPEILKKLHRVLMEVIFFFSQIFPFLFFK